MVVSAGNCVRVEIIIISNLTPFTAFYVNSRPSVSTGVEIKFSLLLEQFLALIVIVAQWSGRHGWQS